MNRNENPLDKGEPRVEVDSLTGEEYYAGKGIRSKVMILFLASTACLICSIAGTLYYMGTRLIEIDIR
ncbi:MAG: hypothetical protein AAB768_00915 [Patescibacteria group bacterium]